MILLRSFVFGLVVAAPMGPMSVICMRRTLTQGARFGLATGIGIALADGAYALAAAFGLTGIVAAAPMLLRLLGIAGGAALLVLGWRFWQAPPPDLAPPSGQPAAKAPTMAAALAGAFLLTLANPPTLFIFAAFFAAMLGAITPNFETATKVGLGVAAGSIAWWVCLTTATARLRHLASPGFLHNISRLAGLVLFGFGIFALARGL